MATYPQPAPPIPPLDDPATSISAVWDNVSVSIRGRRLSRGFSHTARAGGILGVIGPSGSDSDIVLSTLAARRPATAGSVTIVGAPHNVAIARLVSAQIDDPLTTVGESLRAVTPRTPTASPTEIQGSATFTSGSVDLTTRLWGELAPGQRVRAGLSCALASGATVIAANAADVSVPADIARTWQAITQVAGTGRLVLVGWPTPMATMSATATMLAAAVEVPR